MKKIVCIVGMPGAGKTLVSDELKKQGFAFLRFGQITLDKIQEKGLKLNEINEKSVREEFRKEYGMGAFATLNIPKIDELLKKSKVVVDGLYSWSEYKILKAKYSNAMSVIAIYSPPELRYKRLEGRVVKNDKQNRFRAYSRQDAVARDYAEIENIEKGGPISMADFTIINIGTKKEAVNEIGKILKKIK